MTILIILNGQNSHKKRGLKTMVLTFREGKRKTRVSAKVGLGIGENVEWSGVEWAFDSQKHKRRVKSETYLTGK